MFSPVPPGIQDSSAGEALAALEQEGNNRDTVLPTGTEHPGTGAAGSSAQCLTNTLRPEVCLWAALKSRCWQRLLLAPRVREKPTPFHV